MQIINIEDQIANHMAPWHPEEIAKVNNHAVRAVLFHGEYHWHKHIDHDELFYVIKGEITIELKNQENLDLEAGELVVITRGMEHRPIANTPAKVLLFEPQELTATGD